MRFRISFILFVLITALTHSAHCQDKQVDRLKKHLYILASDSLMGRDAGSVSGYKAAQYIADKFDSMGVKPYLDSGYFQHFSKKGRGNYRNVIGFIEGNDPKLKDEYIILSAHYDHVGYEQNGDSIVVYNGADDNASGTSAIIEAARNLMANRDKLSRSIIIIAFDAEEKGLVGSKHFLMTWNKDRKLIKLVVNLDMVGALDKGKKLTYAGVGMLENGAKLFFENIPSREGLTVEYEYFDNLMWGTSDHHIFAMLGIPALYVSTGLLSPYHEPEDDAELIDFEGLDLITDHVTDMVIFSAGKHKLKNSGEIAPKHRPM